MSLRIGWSKISNIRNSYGPLQIIILWVKSNTQKIFFENWTSFRYCSLRSKFNYISRQCAPIWNGATKKIRIFSNFSFQKKTLLLISFWFLHCKWDLFQKSFWKWRPIFIKEFLCVAFDPKNNNLHCPIWISNVWNLLYNLGPP